ncbi:MAG TPA: hypothetical protein V6D34_05330 [Candidatus Sericytochromatia bacterium]
MAIRLVPRSPINQRSIISLCSRLYGMCAIARSLSLQQDMRQVM